MKLQITRRMDNISIDIPIDEILKHTKGFDGMFLLRNGIPVENVKAMPFNVKKAMAEQIIKDLKGNQIPKLILSKLGQICDLDERIDLCE